LEANPGDKLHVPVGPPVLKVIDVTFDEEIFGEESMPSALRKGGIELNAPCIVTLLVSTPVVGQATIEQFSAGDVLWDVEDAVADWIRAGVDKHNTRISRDCVLKISQ
jgi:hypothetical protein